MNALRVITSEIRQHDGLYSLNDLHKASGGARKHQPSNFMRVDTTVALMEEIKSSDLRISPAKTLAGCKGGTYVCKELVYAYAMWISPKFHLAVIRAFDALQQAPTHPPAEPPIAIPMMLGGDAQRLAGQRFLVAFSDEGHAATIPVPPEALVMTPDQFADAIRHSDSLIMTTDTLFRLYEAINARLRMRFAALRWLEKTAITEPPR